MQSTARLAGQTAGVVVIILLFTQTSVDAAPRIGLAIGAVLTLAVGLMNALRVEPIANREHGTLTPSHPAGQCAACAALHQSVCGGLNLRLIVAKGHQHCI
jgi:hypothetical protein